MPLQTLEDVFRSCSVEIPTLRRDYVYGRDGEEVAQIREKLLDDIRTAIDGRNPVDLKLIYGDISDGVFIPIDGHQRLATLYLINIYAYRNVPSQTENLKKFTYQSCIGTRNFFKKLIENRQKIFDASRRKAPSPSAEIKDSPWFETLWENDPTVKYALNMLDLIEIKFKTAVNLHKKLNDKTRISFNCLENIHGIGDEDTFYFRLNARGRKLTSFETFKTLLLDRLRTLRGNKNYLMDFEEKFDGDWEDCFWNWYHVIPALRGEIDMSVNNINECEGKFLRLLIVLFANHFVTKVSDVEDFLDTFSSDDWIMKSKLYKMVDAELFDTIYHFLNRLVGVQRGNALPKNYSVNFILKTLEFDQLQSPLSYKNFLKVHAFSRYVTLSAKKKINPDNFDEFLRIMSNLINNSEFARSFDYRDAINSIDNILRANANVSSYFANLKNPLPGFDVEQVIEERDKAIIFLKGDEDFINKIKEAEEHPYFSGQIRSALYISKTGGRYDKNIFWRYWEKISALFDADAPKKFDEVHLLRRALIASGDYLLDVHKKYKTFYADNPNNYPSLKTLFSDRSLIVKMVLDRISKTNTQKDLETIVKNTKILVSDWRYCFVEYGELFDWMDDRYKRICRCLECKGYTDDRKDSPTHDEWLIVNNSSSGGSQNSELYTTALKIALEHRKESIAKTSTAEYELQNDGNADGTRFLSCVDKVTGVNYAVYYREGEGFIIFDRKIGMRLRNYKPDRRNPFAGVMKYLP